MIISTSCKARGHAATASHPAVFRGVLLVRLLLQYFTSNSILCTYCILALHGRIVYSGKLLKPVVKKSNVTYIREAQSLDQRRRKLPRVAEAPSATVARL